MVRDFTAAFFREATHRANIETVFYHLAVFRDPMILSVHCRFLRWTSCVGQIFILCWILEDFFKFCHLIAPLPISVQHLTPLTDSHSGSSFEATRWLWRTSSFYELHRLWRRISKAPPWLQCPLTPPSVTRPSQLRLWLHGDSLCRKKATVKWIKHLLLESEARISNPGSAGHFSGKWQFSVARRATTGDFWRHYLVACLSKCRGSALPVLCAGEGAP